MSGMIETFDGQYFSLVSDDLEGLNPVNIAHALSMVNRFNGHTKFPYSVAEHSIHVAAQLPPELQLIGLVHDGSEAYIQDIPAPFKPFLPDYARIEKQVQDRVYRSFDLDPEWVDSVYAEVKRVDSMMCQVEATQLLHSKGEGWAHNPDGLQIYGFSPQQAEGLFLLAYTRIMRGDYFTGPLTPDYLTKIVGEFNARHQSN